MQLTSIDTLLSKLSRDYPLQEEPNESYVAEWVREALKLIDNYAQFEKKNLILKVREYNALLPADFYSIDHKNPVQGREQGNRIYFGIREGNIKFHYLAMPMDEKNRPFIPDTQDYLDALTHYVASKMCKRGDIIQSEDINYEKEHDRWLQKKLEARADLHLKNLGSKIQSIADDYHSLTYNTNPRWFSK